MRQNWSAGIRGLSSVGLLLGASLAVTAASCTGDIGDATASSTNPGPGAGTGGIMKQPVGAPGEIAGEGGSGGTSPAGGTGGVVADAGPMNTGTGGGGAPDAGVIMPGSLVHGLAISDVAIYQAVKVSLVKNGAPVTTTNAPLVRNRPAFLRVFVTPGTGWTARSVVARLQWGTGAPRDVMLAISGASTDITLGTTVNFQLAAEDLTPNVQWSVSLYEAPGGTGTGDTTGARIPADGTPAMLTTTDPGTSLKIQMVPIRVNGNLPDTSAAQLKFLTDAMFATYPIAKIEATVRDPIDAPSAVQAQGPGWDSALNQVCMTRQNDKPARNVFYYGLINPAATFQSYCAGGCVEGIAVLATNPNQDFMRCAMGIGYTNQGSGVFLQEVAHSMGRSHAPCGNPAQPDRMYPYANGRIGVWGYDMLHNRLLDPTKTVDFMSYCPQVWISDYTFAALLPWIRAVNMLVPMQDVSLDGTSPEIATGASAALRSSGALTAESTLRFPPARWRMATVESDGGVLWGPLVDFDELAGVESHTVVLRDAKQRQTTVSGVLIPHSRTGGGMLLLPATTPVNGRAIQIGADTIFRELRGVAP